MALLLTIKLKRVSPTHHEFAFVRSDGSGERLTLETKTFLFHDLLHFAAEKEAHLAHSFYGLLAEGRPYADFSGDDMKLPEGASFGELAMTERIVGVLTGFLKSESAPKSFLENLKTFLNSSGEEVPSWLTEEYLLRVKESMRRLLGEWSATPFGETMEILFET